MYYFIFIIYKKMRIQDDSSPQPRKCVKVDQKNNDDPNKSEEKDISTDKKKCDENYEE